MNPSTIFSFEDAHRAYEEWGANCGPGALAAITSRTLEEIRPYLGDFERKKYTNPTLMMQALRALFVRWDVLKPVPNVLPPNALVRVQWEGPWTNPGAPMMARYRHTHWIATRNIGNGLEIFDINCMCVDGWVPEAEWSGHVAPWLIKQVAPNGNGKWHYTHVLKIEN